MSRSPSEEDATLARPSAVPPIPPEQDEPAPTWLVVAAAALAIATAAGGILGPYLAVHHPYWLLTLNAFPRHQILVAPYVEQVPFMVVVALRGLVTCWISYELGRHYGVRGTAAIEGRAPSFGRALRMFEQFFGRFSGAALIVVPGFLSSSLAGMSGLARPIALGLSLIGLSLWAWINHQLGGWLEPWTRYVMKFMTEHMLAATLMCAGIVALYQLNAHRKRRLQLRAAAGASAADKASADL